MAYLIPPPPPENRMICEYCGRTDGDVSKYHPDTCLHCGAKMATLYGYYRGKPITDIDIMTEIIKTTVKEIIS